MTSPDNWGDLYTSLATTVASNISTGTLGITATPLPPANGSSYAAVNPLSIAQIKGEMVTVELNASKVWHSGATDDSIKIQLIQDLLEKLMKSNCIEFTKQVDPNTMDYTYRARIFAVPNTDVQIIRTEMK